MTQAKLPHQASPHAVVLRVNQARGRHLQRTGRDMDWADIGRLLGWKPSTITDVKSVKRPLRVQELAQIAELLDCSPGWLAFAEGSPEGAFTLPPAPPLQPPSAEDRSRQVLLAGGALERKKKRRA